MKIEEAIKQEQFNSPIHKAIVNLIYTFNWHLDRTAGVFRDFDLTPQQYNVLKILRRSYPKALPAGEVKEVMLDKNPDLTRLCDRLCSKGLIERELNPGNRRQVLIKITEPGLATVGQIEPLLEEALQKWHRLSDEEAEQLSNLLDKLRG